MWHCPDCGRQFASRNQWHSCVELALDEHLGRHSDRAVGLYRAVQVATEKCGEFRIHPQKTRIAFIARMTFAGATLASRWIDVSFIAPGPIDDSRIRRLELYGPTSFAHMVRIYGRNDIDGDLRDWLCEAWLRGTQETVDSTAQLMTVEGHARAVLTVPLASRVLRIDGELLLALPRYATQAIGIGAPVNARIPGESPHPAIVSEPGLRFDADVIRSHGLGEGDDVDVFLRPA